MKNNKKTIMLILVLSLSACSAGPNFSRPPVIKNDRYISNKDLIMLDASQIFVNEQSLYRNWWKNFNSEKLNTLINKALNNSPTLDAAEAVLRQYKELYSAKFGDVFYPQLGSNFSSARQRFNAATSGRVSESKEFSLYNIGANLSYMFDFAGGNKYLLESLAAKIDYQKYKLDGARLTLISSIAINAISQAGISEQIKILTSILRSQEGQLDIVKKKIALGQLGENEQFVLQTKIDQTRASLAVLEKILQQNKHQIAILVGEEPSIEDLPSFSLADFSLPENLPLTVPSELIRSRPDILASEALLKVANADYGVAISKLYPQITLGVDISSLALSFSNLFSASSNIWNLVGQITQPLFKPGLSAEKRAALAGFDAALANYKVVVLEALRDVADTLYSIDGNSKRLKALLAANTSSQQFLSSVKNRYRLGAASYLELLLAQEQSQKTKFDLIDVQTKRLINIVSFFQSIGKYH